MSVLTLVQQFCRNHALNVPTSVVGSLNTTVTQIYGLLSELLEEITTESDFTWLTQETTFTAVAAEDQGLLTTLAPAGFERIIEETLFDRTNRRHLLGPLSPEEWQALQALDTPSATYYYRVREGHFYLYPAPDASALPTIAFEYASSWIVQDSAGTPKEAITADNDIFALPEKILRRGLAAKWKNVKGLPYQSDENKFYELLNNYIARDGTKPTINVGEKAKGLTPGILVPTGNWNV